VCAFNGLCDILQFIHLAWESESDAENTDNIESVGTLYVFTELCAHVPFNIMLHRLHADLNNTGIKNVIYATDDDSITSISPSHTGENIEGDDTTDERESGNRNNGDFAMNKKLRYSGPEESVPISAREFEEIFFAGSDRIFREISDVPFPAHSAFSESVVTAASGFTDVVLRRFAQPDNIGINTDPMVSVLSLNRWDVVRNVVNFYVNAILLEGLHSSTRSSSTPLKASSDGSHPRGSKPSTSIQLKDLMPISVSSWTISESAALQLIERTLHMFSARFPEALEAFDESTSCVSFDLHDIPTAFSTSVKSIVDVVTVGGKVSFQQVLRAVAVAETVSVSVKRRFWRLLGSFLMRREYLDYCIKVNIIDKVISRGIQSKAASSSGSSVVPNGYSEVHGVRAEQYNASPFMALDSTGIRTLRALVDAVERSRVSDAVMAPSRDLFISPGVLTRGDTWDSTFNATQLCLLLGGLSPHGGCAHLAAHWLLFYLVYAPTAEIGLRAAMFQVSQNSLEDTSNSLFRAPLEIHSFVAAAAEILKTYGLFGRGSADVACIADSGAIARSLEALEALRAERASLFDLSSSCASEKQSSRVRFDEWCAYFRQRKSSIETTNE
jgi:hypothetical protein